MPELPAKGEAPATKYPNWVSLSPADVDDPVYRVAAELRDNLNAVVNEFVNEGWVTSQADLSARLGLPKSTLSRLSRGLVWPQARLIAYLEVTLERPIWPSTTGDVTHSKPEFLG